MVNGMKSKGGRRTNFEAVPSRNRHTIGVIGVIFAKLLAQGFWFFFMPTAVAVTCILHTQD